MKKFISLVLAASIIAFLVFAVMYWLFGSDILEARQTAITVGLSGFLVEYLRPAITKWSKRFDIRRDGKQTS